MKKIAVVFRSLSSLEVNLLPVPAAGGSTLACPSGLKPPSPPAVKDTCGNQTPAPGPVVRASPSCEGDVTYVWTYTDCEGNGHDWTYTYTIEYEDFTVPADGGSTIACPSGLNTPSPLAVTATSEIYPLPPHDALPL